MRRAALTRDDVFAAASALAATGQRPTLELIRAQIGGSYTTIKNFLREWEAEQGRGQERRGDMPAEITEMGVSLVQAVWETATRLAAQETAQVRAAAASEVQAARAALAAAEAEIARLEAAAEEDARTIDELRAAVEQRDARIAQLEREAAVAEARTAEQQETIARLERELAAAQARANEQESALTERLAILDRLLSEQRAAIAALTSARSDPAGSGNA